MVTEQTRNAVWQVLLDVARLVRYYEALSDRHRRNHLIVRFLLLAAATSSIAALLHLIPDIAQPVASSGVALLVVWDFVSDYAKKAAVLHTISLECNALEIEGRELWDDIEDYNVAADGARRKKQQLERKLLEVTGRAGQADIRQDRKLNEKCEKDAYKITVERYAI